MPPEALSWNDADDNNAYHEKLIRDGFRRHAVHRTGDDQGQEGLFEEMVVMGLPNGNDGKPMPRSGRRRRRLHPEGREERRGRQGIHEILHAAAGDEREPEGRTGPLGAGDSVDRARTTRGGSIPRTRTGRPMCRKPCWARPSRATTASIRHGGRCSAEQLWGVAHADVIKNGMTPEAAVDKAFKRAEAIFAKYTFG